MELAIRERAIRPKGGPRNLRVADPLPTLSWLLQEIFPVTEGKSVQRPALKERTTRTIHDPAKHTGRPVMVATARRLIPYDAAREAIRSLVGRTISHYRIVAKLGSGGMGVVYRAKDVRLQRHVALKFSTNEMLAEADPYECILREAHAGSMVNHPNVCAVYDIGEFQGLPFIVMELLEGQTLKERIKEPLTLGQFLHLAIQVSRQNRHPGFSGPSTRCSPLRLRVLKFRSYNFNALRHSEFPTTETELKLIAAAAIIGFNACRNRHTQGVYINAKKRFCRMLLIVARLSRRARTIPVRSPLTSVTPALSVAISVPVPMEPRPRQRDSLADANRPDEG